MRPLVVLITAVIDIEAYNLYLQGRYFWNKRSEQGIFESLGLFEKAIAEDPAYALAYVGLADAALSNLDG